MKNIFLILLFLASCFSVSAQVVDSVTVVEPGDFPVETNLPGNVAFYTREGGTNRKVTLSAIFDKTVGYTAVQKEQFQVQAATNNIILSASPDIASLEVFRGVIRQTVNTSGADVTASGNVLTFNYRNLKPGETVLVRYRKTYN